MNETHKTNPKASNPLIQVGSVSYETSQGNFFRKPIIGSLFALLMVEACDKSQNEKRHSGDPSGMRKTKSENASYGLEKFRRMQNEVPDSQHIEQIALKSNLISEELKKLSPEALIQLFATLDLSNNSPDKGLIPKILYALADSDPKLALEAASKLPQNNPVVVMGLLYSRMVATNPAAVSEWISSSDLKQGANFNLATKCSIQLASDSPGIAIEMLEKANDETRKKLARLVLGQIAQKDPQQALVAVGRISTGKDSESYYASVISGAGVTDGALAFSFLSNIHDPKVSAKACGSLFLSWIQQDPRTAGEALATLPPISVQTVFENPANLSALIARDGSLATKALDQMVYTEANAKIFAQAARELGAKDSAAAVAWIGSFPDSPKKGELIREVITSRAAADPSTSVPKILNEQSSYRNDVVTGAGTAWGRVDAGAALQYVPRLPVEEQKTYAMAVLKASFKSGPDVAAKCISENSLPSAVRDSTEYREMVNSAATNFAARDLPESVKWASSLSNAVSEAAVSGVASQWARNDPTAAGEWIHQLPAGPARNAAIRALVGEIENTDPDAARQWKASMTK